MHPTWWQVIIRAAQTKTPASVWAEAVCRKMGARSRIDGAEVAFGATVAANAAVDDSILLENLCFHSNLRGYLLKSNVLAG